MAEEAGRMGPGRSLDGRDSSFATLSEIFSNQYLDVLTHPLRISSAICSSGSLLMLFTCLTTSYWVTERSPHGLVHSGLWETCVEPTCRYFPFNVPEHLHVTRAFLIMALLCGVASLLFVCFSFEHTSIGPIYFMVVAGLLSFTAGFFTLIAISVFTAVYKSKASYIQHLIIFGSSYGLCWASIPTYIMTESFQLQLSRSARNTELQVPFLMNESDQVPKDSNLSRGQGKKTPSSDGYRPCEDVTSLML